MGKSRHDENFPVASLLVRSRHRPVIRAFYDFVRTADDVADDPALGPGEKLRELAAMENALLIGAQSLPCAARLHKALAVRGLSPRHALCLIDAFRIDAMKQRYADWDDLMGYCALSAAPVGRFVLDVHGEAQVSWPASDALCAALQILNHLQDCGADYGQLDRVYLPADMMAAHGATEEELGERASSPPLRAAIAAIAVRVRSELLPRATRLPPAIRDPRLALEVGVIVRLADALARRLEAADPIAARLEIGGVWLASAAMRGVLEQAALRVAAPLAATFLQFR